jgi:hypothetical protein
MVFPSSISSFPICSHFDDLFFYSPPKAGVEGNIWKIEESEVRINKLRWD